ncbi:ketose-bisphosphate aldolase [Patescibacteria group bacterium]
MLVHTKELITKIKTKSFAVGSFNTCNLEMTLGIIQAAQESNSPVIVQVSENEIKYAGLKPITHIVETIAKNEAINVPISLHLDHGKSFHSVAECIHAGFSSIQIDASDLPFDENVVLTKQVVDYAHKFGVWVQGELGAMTGKEGVIALKMGKKFKAEEHLTNPEEVVEFVEKTKIDTLAVSVGTIHGLFPGLEKVDHKRLKKINDLLKGFPLVLHGASGTSDSDIKQSLKEGIRIINVGTRLRMEFTQALRNFFANNYEEQDPRKILIHSVSAVKEAVKEKMELFGSAGKA